MYRKLQTVSILGRGRIPCFRFLIFKFLNLWCFNFICFTIFLLLDMYAPPVDLSIKFILSDNYSVFLVFSSICHLHHMYINFSLSPSVRRVVSELKAVVLNLRRTLIDRLIHYVLHYLYYIENAEF